MAPSSPLVFACPRCRSVLRADERSYGCSACRSQYPVVDGIPTFVEGGGYWGEIPAEDMAWLVAEVERGRPWREVVETAPRPSVRDKASFLLDTRRASWALDLGLPEGAAILDIGAGMGGVAAGLAPHAARVIALEPVLLRARFIKARLAQDGVDSVTVVRGDAHTLPFPPASFDVIVLSGVLEWLGKGTPDPARAQLEVLTRLRELLRPEGALVVGIENRIGIWYFLGRQDHSYLAYTSLMPRWLANLVTRARRGHAYDTYTYTYRGYRRLLAEAGFDRMRTMLPIWGYNAPDFLMPVEPRGPRENLASLLMGGGGRAARWPWLRSLHLRFRLSRTFANDFIFFAATGRTPRPGRLAAALAARSNAYGLAIDAEQLSFLIHNRSHPTLVAFPGDGRSAGFIARLSPVKASDETGGSRSGTGFSAPRAEITALRRIAPVLVGPLAGSAPRPLDLFVDGPYEVGVTTFMAGESPVLPAGDPLARSTVARVDDLIAAALGWLTAFHRALAPDSPTRELTGIGLAAQVTAHPRSVLPEGDALADRLGRQLELAGRLGTVVCPPQHGDFVLSNIRIAGDRIGVIDWERFGRVSVPGFDAMHVVNYAVICLLAEPKSQKVDADRVIGHLLDRSPLGDPLRGRVEAYLEAQGFERGAFPALYAAYLAAFVGEYGGDPARRGIVGLMGSLLRAVLSR